MYGGALTYQASPAFEMGMRLDRYQGQPAAGTRTDSVLRLEANVRF